MSNSERQILFLIARLSSRSEMNERTAKQHPDLGVQISARARAEAYRTAVMELTAIMGPGIMKPGFMEPHNANVRSDDA